VVVVVVMEERRLRHHCSEAPPLHVEAGEQGQMAHAIAGGEGWVERGLGGERVGVWKCWEERRGHLLHIFPSAL